MLVLIERRQNIECITVFCVWYGLHSRRTVRVPMLTPVYHRKHTQWPCEHQISTTVQWKKVAWSNESRFLLHHVHVHHLPGEHLAPECTMGRKQAGRGSVMDKIVWESHIIITLYQNNTITWWLLGFFMS